MKENLMSKTSTADLDGRIDSTTATVETIAKKIATVEAARLVLAVRAARGEDVTDSEWKAMEDEAGHLGRCLARSELILKALLAEVVALGRATPLAAATCAGRA